MSKPLDKTQIAALMKRFPIKELATGNVRTCPFRLSFPAIFKKDSFEGGDEKYGATLLFPLGTDLSYLEKLCNDAAVAEFGNKVNLKSLRMPFRDQGEKEYAGYVDGAKFFRAYSNQRPGVRGPDGKPLENEEDLYAGCWCIATLKPLAFDNKGKGVTFGLQNIAKIADDESFGGKPADADEEFGDVLDGSAVAEDMFA